MVLAASPNASARSKKSRSNNTRAIDDFCGAIRRQFRESAPRYFSGPNPWVESDDLPDDFTDAAIATVYHEGARVSWVVLEVAGNKGAWFETTQYFFDEAGLIRKRVRHFEAPSGNVQIDEDTYFEKGRAIKNRYHHAPLAAGKENWDTFADPDAPNYTSTAQLPVVFLDGELRQLAEEEWRPVCVPGVLEMLTNCP